MAVQHNGGSESTQTLPYRAILLDERVTADLEQIEQLLSDRTVEVLDLRQRQHDWLNELLPPPPDDMRNEPDRWVYFPWRRTMVGLVGPRAFRAMRLDRNRDKITAAEQNHFAGLKIGVVGLSVGHAIAYTLALEGLCGELRLADHDEIELTNLNRIPGSVFDLGINKAVVAARRIAEIDPYVRTTAYLKGFTDDMAASFFDGLDIVVEECDSLDAKVRVREEARARGIPLLMEMSDRGMIDVERYDLEPTRPLFHGLLGDLDPAELAGLSRDEAMPYYARMCEADKLSPRMIASLGEIGRTMSSWPQLGGDVALGGASVAAAVRRIGLGEPLRSGRIRVDIADKLDQLEEPAGEPIS